MTTPTTTAIHPLGTLTSTDIDSTHEVLDAAGMLGDTVRFVYVGVDEPRKQSVLAAESTRESIDRRVRVMLIDLKTNDAVDVVVSVTDAAIVSRRAIDPAHGQPPLTVAEFAIVDEIVEADPGWAEALASREIGERKVVLTPLSAGNFDIDGESNRRMVRVVAFLQDHETDNQWAHPVDGLCAWVDLSERVVTRIVDSGPQPIPAASGNFHDRAEAGEPRTDLKPIEISQPNGPSFTLKDGEIRWADWVLRVGFDAREGLVLHRIRFVDGGEERDVIYRASIAEMVVPYADPSPVHFFQNYFDAGEYLYGRTVNSLELGCDCVGDITYVDAVMADELGRPRTVKNAVCIHEEDFGTLWKHTENWLGDSIVRRQRRLVVSSFTTVGNYDYGFFWYFYLDGRIECEAKLNGIVFTAAYSEETVATSNRITRELSAPYHQHIFGARLDMMVDGVANAVDEVDFVRMPVGPDNPYGNAFTTSTTRLRTESEGTRDANATVGRSWHIVSGERTNTIGEPTGYQLIPEASPTLLADPSSSIAGRAAFGQHHLWVTRYTPSERYPAGDFVYQSPAGEGLPAYIAADRDIDGKDIVLWHTFGPSHAPRLEDWPIMPVDYARFQLKPFGFFDRNPTLTAPESNTAHCAPAERHQHVNRHEHDGHDHSHH